MIGSNGIGELVEQVSLLPDDPSIANISVVGRFHVECFDKAGNLRWEEEFRNGVTNLGFNLMLDSTFRSNQITPISYWYVGLISNVSYSALNAADTMASHTGWTEDSTHWTPATFSGAVNNVGGYSAGATTMAINGVSQAIANGTCFTVAGSSGTYQITSSVGGATPTSITFTPGLASSVANSAAISFGNGRPLWTPGAAASKSITNSTSVNFAINTDSTVIKGIFITSDPTLGGTAGTLWSTGLFSADQTLFNGDTLKITYTVSLS